MEVGVKEVGLGVCKETKNKHKKTQKKHAVSWERSIINNSSSGGSENNSFVTSIIVLTMCQQRKTTEQKEREGKQNKSNRVGKGGQRERETPYP